jgi:DNA-binding beta-propeller fold protein YncE
VVLAASFGIVLLVGCAAQKTGSKAVPAAPLVWPALPDPPRIAYVRSITRPADLGIKTSAFKRFGQWLTGSETGNETLIKPFGISFDENDNLCLTDTGENVVCYYDQGKKKWRRWEKLGNLRFVAPVAVAKTGESFFVADSGLASVLAFDENGKLWRQMTNHLQRPSGLALMSNQLFVADSQRHCVVVFDLQGIYQSEFGRRGNGEGQFNFPTHLAADREGHLLVTDSLNSRVQIFDTQGKFLGLLGALGDSPGHFSRPKGLASDSLGHIYVIDALFDNIQVFDHAGQLLLNLGVAGSQAGEFWLPNGIAINHNNEIFVTDSYNHRVQVFRYIGSE